MFVHGFRSSKGAEVRVYTLELTYKDQIDEDVGVPLQVPVFLVLAVLKSVRERGGFENRRSTMTYFVDRIGIDGKEACSVEASWNYTTLDEEEVAELNRFVHLNGLKLVKWMKSCPVKPKRGRSVSV